MISILTEREAEVLKLIVNGLSNKEIAFELRITERTVKAHRQAVMRKLKVDSVALLVRKVYGLLETEPQITIPIFNY
jgi:DNA-binding NarL/FixJ family response regulator